MIAKVLRLFAFVSLLTLFGMSMTANAATNDNSTDAVAMESSTSITISKDTIGWWWCPPYCG